LVIGWLQGGVREGKFQVLHLSEWCQLMK
jgi:hypothetical protein